MPEALLLHFDQVKTPGTFNGLRALHHDLTSSSIRTIPLVPELHRFGCHWAVRGLYRQWGISPRPEDLICCTIWTISPFYEFCNAAFNLFCIYSLRTPDYFVLIYRSLRLPYGYLTKA